MGFYQWIKERLKANESQKFQSQLDYVKQPFMTPASETPEQKEKDPKAQEPERTDTTKEIDEYTYFEDIENQRLLQRQAPRTNKPSDKLETTLFKSSSIAGVYAILSSLTVLYLIAYSVFFGAKSYQEYSLNKEIHIISYFSLQSVNPLVFYSANCCTSVLGILVVMLVILNMKNNRLFFSKYMQYLSLATLGMVGSMAFMVTITVGFLGQLVDLKNLEVLVSNRSNMTLNQICLLSRVWLLGAFTCLYFYIGGNTRPGIIINRAILERKQEWFNYKILVLIYMVIFSLIYILSIVVFKCKAIANDNLNGNFIKDMAPYICSIMPYILHVFFDLLIFTFCEDLSHISISLIETKKEIDDKNIL